MSVVRIWVEKGRKEKMTRAINDGRGDGRSKVRSGYMCMCEFKVKI